MNGPVCEHELDALMSRLADGDRSAFEPLYVALKPRVLSLCRAMLGQQQDAEDATQVVLERVFARAATFERGRAVVPWALGIAAWQCRALRQTRKRRREDVLGEDAAPLLSAHELTEELARSELRKLAQTALGALSENDRETLTATFWDEAKVAGAAGATMRKRRERALERLRAAFWRLYGLDPVE